MVHAARQRGTDIARVAADTGKIVAQLRVPARGRFGGAVALVVEQALARHRGYARARLLLDVKRGGRDTAIGAKEGRTCVGVGGGTDVVDAVLADRVFHGLAQRIGDLISRPDVAAQRELAEAGEVLVVALDHEQVEADRQVAILEIGIGEADVALLRAERSHYVDAHIVATAEQIAFMNAGVDQRAVGGREAHPEGEVAGRFLLDIHVDHGLVRRAALDVGDGDLLEEVEVLDALLRALHLGGVEGVALVDAHLAPDHAVERAQIAVYVDALDIDARAFLDHVAHVDGAIGGVAVRLRLDVDKGEATVAERVAQNRDRLFDLIGVVPIAFMGEEQRLETGGIDL